LILAISVLLFRSWYVEGGGERMDAGVPGFRTSREVGLKAGLVQMRSSE